MQAGTVYFNNFHAILFSVSFACIQMQ